MDEGEVTEDEEGSYVFCIVLAIDMYPLRMEGGLTLLAPEVQLESPSLSLPLLLMLLKLCFLSIDFMEPNESRSDSRLAALLG